MSGQPLISVIVPIYQVEAYLRPCVDSILAQTYETFQVILVDDGSPDGCPALCDAYAAQDPRVRVIHKPNGGLSDARNAGLAAAEGAYISFVDGDDLISPRFLELLAGPGADIAQCGFSTRGPEALADGARFETLDRRDMALGQCRDDTGAYTVVWNKLWRREVLSDLWFPVGRQHEDEFFSWRAYRQADRCAVTDAPLYYYRQRPDSIMDRGFSQKRLDAADALEERAAAYLAAGDEELFALTQAVLCHQLRDLQGDLKRALPDRAGAYRTRMRRAYGDVLGSASVGARKKLSLSLQMLSPRLYKTLKGGNGP